MKLLIVKSPELYAAYLDAYPYCQACGIDMEEAERLRWPGLSRHHIVQFKRSDEWCNLLVLCQRDHALAEGLAVRENGALLPALSVAICLSLKRCRDAANFNMERSLELLGRRELDLVPVPVEIEAEFRRRRPWDEERFYRCHMKQAKE